MTEETKHEYATTLCPHFGDCGGCQAQDIPYETQVANKAVMLEELFADYWTEPIPVTPSPVLWHYRNKVDPSFAPKQYDEPPPKDFERDTVLGFKKKGRWFWPLEISECRIGPEGMAELMESVRAWYRQENLKAYSNKTEEGFLRALLVRDAKHTGERMVVLITRPGELPADSFVECVQRVFPATSIYHGIFERSADVAMADELFLLHGAPTITEELHLSDGDAVRKLSFRISPFSFFQTNTLATELLYGQIRTWVKESAPAVMYDLYGGAGGIAFSCSDLVDQVWSVENVPEASEDGRFNAGENGINNVDFTTEKVKNYLLYRLREGAVEENALAVLDPPRSGMHPKALRRIIELGPKSIIYVSCNPKILAQEMASLSEAYTLEEMRAVDLFPHTRHVEALAHLKRK